MSRIFVSYRHDDAAGHAGRVFDHLVARFGEDSVFRDVERIAPGTNSVEALDRALVPGHAPATSRRLRDVALDAL